MNSTIIPSPLSEPIAWVVPSLPQRSRRIFHSAGVILLSIILPLSSVSSFSQEGRPTESQLKAAYLYNFGKFVRQQNDRTVSPDSFDICILGKDPFGSVLDSTVEGDSIDGKIIKVRRLSKVPEGRSCSILFVSSSEEGSLRSILTSVQPLGVLTVSDVPRFAEKGGMIGFVKQEDRIRFEVNRSAAEQSHLVLSSELLKVAVKVLGN